jgi:hypothetical protein
MGYLGQIRLRALWLLLLTGSIALVVAGRSTIAQQPPTFDIVTSGFNDAVGLAVDPVTGAIVVADRQGGRVVELTPTGQQIWQVTGLDRPAGVAFDASGAVLIVEEHGGSVLRRDPSGAVTVLVAGLFRPRWITVASDGTLYLSARDASGGSNPNDNDGGLRILQVLTSGTVRTFATGFKGLEGLAVSGQSVYAATRGLTSDGPGVTTRLVRFPIQSNGTAGPIDLLLWGSDHVPGGVTIDRLGALALSTRPGNGDIGTVLKRQPAGAIGTLADGLQHPTGTAFEAAGNLLVVEGATPGRLLRFRALAPPTVTAPAFTSQSPVSLSGQTAVGALVQVFGTASLTSAIASVVADTNGGFTLSVPLALNAQTSLWFTATEAGGQGLTSAPVSYAIVHDDSPAISTLLAPPAGVHVRGAVTVSARGEDLGSGVASLAVALDNVVLATITNPNPTQPLTTSVTIDTSAVAEGARTIAAIATDRAGNTGGSAQLLVVDRTPPDTQIVSGPSGSITGTSATFVVSGTDAQSTTLDFSWRLDNGAWSPFSAATSIALTNLASGAHTFEVKARDLAGNEDQTAAAQTFNVGGFSIHITEPLPGAVIATDFAWVRGTVTGGDVTIAVPLTTPIFGLTSVPGLVENGVFVARVPVDPTITQLTVVATAVAGGTAQDSVNVAVSPAPNDELRLQAWPAGGLAPLTVGIQVLNPIESSSVVLDANGDGAPDFSGTTLGIQSYTFTQPGLYTPKVSIIDINGQSYQAQGIVQVYDRTALDARLQAVWTGFKDALRAGNVPTAMTFIHSDRRQAWQDYFSQFTAQELAAIDQVFTSIELAEVGFGGAQYEMQRDVGGLFYSYAVWFAFDRDGQWRLQKF